MKAQGPLDWLYDAGMFNSIVAAKPLSMEEWEGLMEFRRELVGARLNKIFQPTLGHVNALGYGSLENDKPKDPAGVLCLRGLYFERARVFLERPNRVCFVGIDTDAEWRLVQVHYHDGRNQRRAMRVIASKSSVRQIVDVGIDPLQLLRWMDNWCMEWRNSRYEQFLQAQRLEAIFAAQTAYVIQRGG